MGVPVGADLENRDPNEINDHLKVREFVFNFCFYCYKYCHILQKCPILLRFLQTGD